jgi:hypothetical protein
MAHCGSLPRISLSLSRNGNNPINLIDPDGGSKEGGDNKYKGFWNDETCEYDYSYVDDTGGEFFDVVDYEGGENDGLTSVFV